MRLLKAFGAGFGAMRDSVPRLISIARELGLEIVGFVYWVFAALFVFSPFGAIQSYRSLPETFWGLVVSVVLALLFSWFGFSSFRRAKNVAKQR